MSRIGKRPVDILPGVKVHIEDNCLKVEGPKGKIDFKFSKDIVCEEKDNKLFFNALKDTKPVRAIFGTTRALAKNMIIGVTSGFSKTLIIEGVGYKAQTQGKNLRLNVGFTHPVDYSIPDGIKIDASKQVEIVVSGIDKTQVGQVAAEIRRVCPPEPYKGKGIHYKDERIRRKVGKAVTK